MKKLVILLILCITPFLGKASHIVGGEFELIHISGSTYRLNLILYFDLAHGSAGAKDMNVNARVFRMADNFPIITIPLPLTSESLVNYSQPECSIGDLVTNKLIYTTTITLDQQLFNDPAGYYVAWERCCRNYDIDNVYSDDPNSINPDPTAEGKYAGQTFYLEFPAVVKNGVPFIDSTPKLFPPLSDYACVGKPYYVDFAGTDDDGDSLVYSLVTPLNTKSPDALPLPNPPGLPRPKPYPDVTWRPGFGLDKVLQGSPDLAISSEGLLTVTPTQSGLFVFAVKCEEFRDGVKIGETRRDFQMLAVVCKTAVPPIIKGRNLLDADFTYRDNMNISFPHSIPDSERCIEVQIYDPDIHNDFDSFQEKIKIRSRGINGAGSEVFLPTIKNAILNEADSTATFKICFDKCPPNFNTPYQIQIIASDDACALPLLDTLRITVNVQTPPNARASFIAPASNVVASLNEGDPKMNWPVKIVDPDGDQLTVSYFTDGFNLADVGMDFDFSQPVQGIIEDTLSWDPSCDKYDFSIKRNFNITIIADDNDFCSYNIADTTRFYLTLIPPPNADPIIDVDITTVYSEEFVDGGEYRIFNKINFNVFGHDDDVGYPISLEGYGLGYQLTNYGMDFPGASGNNDITSHFSWPLECSLFDLNEKDSFNIRFIVIDKNNKCKIYQADSVDVTYKILPPLNDKPEISLTNMNPETTVAANTADSFWGNEIKFLVNGTDADNTPVVDNISIELFEATGNVAPAGYSFNAVTGKQNISSEFIWTPDCSVFSDDIYTNHYEFMFRIWDDHCASAEADTVVLELNVSDYISTDESFQPASVITPNGDEFNSYFALDGYELRADGTNPNLEINLPLDNCINRFEYINIYNRWGKLVYTSDNRYFKWYAPNAGAGVYYYFLKFSNKDYKGSILVRF